MRRAYATGKALPLTPPDDLFVTQHGRDQLHSNWPDLYKPEEEATLPAEELMLLKSGGDYGWPECYYDGVQKKLVLAPEYGGDGGKNVGVCANKLGPAAAFPAHWGPNGAVHYDGKSFPARYRDGVFIAFHGSWNRAPYAQGGYNVVFQPLDGDQASGTAKFSLMVLPEQRRLRKVPHIVPQVSRSDQTAHSTFPTTYEDESIESSTRAIPQGPHRRPLHARAFPLQPAMSLQTDAQPPESNTAGLPVPEGSSPEMVALGDRIYHGQVGGASCAGCHGANGTGSPLGPDLTKKKWLWSDGSFAGILKVITDGVPQPKQYRSPMPPMGGAQLSDTQASAVAAYVWALSHPAVAAGNP